MPDHITSQELLAALLTKLSVAFHRRNSILRDFEEEGALLFPIGTAKRVPAGSLRTQRPACGHLRPAPTASAAVNSTITASVFQRSGSKGPFKSARRT